MIDITIHHYYDPTTHSCGYISIAKSGSHSKTLIKNFRYSNESRIVFHAMNDTMESVNEYKRAGQKLKIHVSRSQVWKIIRNRYIFNWAVTGFREAGKESHPDLFKKFVKLVSDFKHVSVVLDPSSDHYVSIIKKNILYLPNLFEDDFWERHHGILIS